MKKPKPKPLKKPKIVKVRIHASQRVVYDQEIEMTAGEYADLKKQFNDAGSPRQIRQFVGAFTSPLADLLDLRDSDSTDDFEDIEIEKAK